jgi:hypothetical protein
MYRIGLAIFKIRIDRLKSAGKSLEKIMYCFKEMSNDKELLPTILIEEAFSFTFGRNLIKEYEIDYEKVKVEEDIKKKEID